MQMQKKNNNVRRRAQHNEFLSSRSTAPAWQEVSPSLAASQEECLIRHPLREGKVMHISLSHLSPGKTKLKF